MHLKQKLEQSGNFDPLFVPDVVGTQCLSKVGAQILWDTSVEALVLQSKSFEN